MSNPLRKRAEELKSKPGYKSRIDILIDSLPTKEQEELLDLLKGEPLLSHSSVAVVIDDVFGEVDGHKILDRNVMDWRRAKGVRLNTQKRGDSGEQTS